LVHWIFGQGLLLEPAVADANEGETVNDGAPSPHTNRQRSIDGKLLRFPPHPPNANVSH
jgi:hypothetical protein